MDYNNQNQIQSQNQNQEIEKYFPQKKYPDIISQKKKLKQKLPQKKFNLKNL